jgi:flagellar motor switch protein FliN/FliY
VEAADIDLGMEGAMPEPEPGGRSVALALEVADFGQVVVVQQVDAMLARFLEQHAVEQIVSAPVPAAAPAEAVVDEAPPVPAGPLVDAQPVVAEAASADNVVALPSAGGNDPAAEDLSGRSQGDLEMLMNVPLPLTVELGSTQRTIRELVDFTVGSIIELGKLAGDPLDIKVNDRVIARGEVVVIDEEFGIRVTEIVSPEQRLADLG